MTYYKLYEEAICKLDRDEITLGEFDEMIKPLHDEVRPTGRWIEGKYKDIPQNPTNGDMIKAVFPDIALYEKKHDAIEISFNGVWWNAPYERR